MGAGYAAALGGMLVSALGAEDDPITRDAEGLLKRYGVVARPVRIVEQPADWTLLVTSGPHGDKLPIGFRGCHEGWAAGPDTEVEPCSLRVVAGLPNPLAARILEAPGAGVRLFAPAARNMAASPSIASFARSIDLLSCNRGEWETLSKGDRGEILGAVPVVVVTDGAAGCTVWFHSVADGRLSFPVFPRTRPPADTNRAGETFATNFLLVLLESGWRPGPVVPELIARAATRASAAAALVLDLRDFGFPTQTEIDAALARGFVGPGRASAEEL
jgi:ribokinase